MPEYATAGLNDRTIAKALRVPAHGQEVGRAVIDGAVVTYALDEPPLWLRAVIRAQDEDGNTHDAVIVRASDEDSTPYLLEFEQGTAITGAA